MKLSMDRVPIAHSLLEQAERLPNAAPSAITHALREIAEVGTTDPERALDLACERLVQSIAATERLRGELRARRAAKAPGGAAAGRGSKATAKKGASS